ncbi:MAG: hypothetical protein AAGB22_06965, partial [Bacteroidota bacterium]
AAGDTLAPQPAPVKKPLFRLKPVGPPRTSKKVIQDTKSPPLSKRIVDNLSVNGYFRMYALQRSLRDPFVVIPGNQFANTPTNVLGVGDRYRDPPYMLMNVSTKPNSRTYIGMDFSFGSFFNGDLDTERQLTLNLGINLIGSIRTTHGKFTVQAGGINWYRISDLTFGAFNVTRYSLFERSPWGPNVHSVQRGRNLMETGQASPTARFGKQAWKGFILEGYELPEDFSFTMMFGKTAVNADLTDSIPNFAYGGQLKKSFGKNFLAYNTMNYTNYTDSLAEVKAGINLHTLEYRWTWKDILFTGEVGMGRQYLEQASVDDWGEAITLKFKTPKRLTFLPIELGLFQLSPKFRNFFGAFQSLETTINNNLDQTPGGGIANGTAASFGGSIADVGQLTNNRRGFFLNTEYEIGGFKINVGNMVSREIDIMDRGLAFGHKINGLPFSRFVTFSNNVGPYGRWTSFFRGFVQGVAITDIDTATGLPFNQTAFNSFQVQAMQQLTVFKRTLFIHYLALLGSAQDYYSVIPVFSDAAYLRAHYHEWDVFYEVNSWLTPVLSYGFERVWGNRQTGLGDNVTGVVGEVENDPVNQTSTHIGLGLDMIFSETTGLYIRHRRFTQKDDSFTLDDIKGNETTIEFKIFF